MSRRLVAPAKLYAMEAVAVAISCEAHRHVLKEPLRRVESNIKKRIVIKDGISQTEP